MKKRLGIISILFTMVCTLFAASPAIEKKGSITAASQLLENGKSDTVTVFAINDFHGTVEEDISGKNPGIAKMNEVLNELRACDPESIFVSAGDNYQGSALSNLSKGKIVSDYFLLSDLATSTVGNHEFDWGEEFFPVWERDGQFDFIAANLIDKKSGTMPEWCDAYKLYNIGGHLIALIGIATPDTVFTASKKRIDDYEFLDPATTVRKTIRELDALYEPEAVVVLSHIGTKMNRLMSGSAMSCAEYDELEEVCKVRGVDAVISGHSHQLVEGMCYGTPVIQARNYGRAISKIQFSFTVDGLKKVSIDVIDFYKDKSGITPDSSMLALVGAYRTKYGAELGERITSIEAELSHEETIPNVTPLGYTIASLMRSAFDVDMAITNGGGLRKSLKAGSLTVNDMWELIPFDNTGVKMSVTGSNLKKIIDHGINSVGFRAGQFAGGTVYYTTQAPEGKRVKKIILDDGREVNDTDVYTIVVNDFMFDGGDLYLMLQDVALEATNTYVPFRDAVIKEMKKMETIDKSWAEIPDVLISE